MKIRQAESGGSQHLTLRVDSTFTALTLTRWRPGQSGVCLGHLRSGTRSVSKHCKAQVKVQSQNSIIIKIRTTYAVQERETELDLIEGPVVIQYF